jgi:membrane-associated phospholipid phosphatase
MGRVIAVLCACWLVAGSAAAQDDSSASLPSFASLFTDLGQDAAHLGTASSLEALGVGGGAALALRPYETRINPRTVRQTTAEDLLDPGQVVGHGFMQVGGAFGTYAIGRLAHNARIANLGSELFRAQILNGAITEGLKLAVRRDRPDHGPYSFPSGHSSATFATAAVIEHVFGWKLGLPAYGIATYVATSRLAENQHFASDVVFGAAIGIASARAVTFGHGHTKMRVAPFASTHSRGIELTLM